MHGSWLPTAAGGPTASGWILLVTFSVAGLAVAVVAGRWLTRVLSAADRRERRQIELRRDLARAVPEALRPSRPPAVLLLAVVGVAAASGALALALSGPSAAVITAAAVLGIASWRMDRDRRREGEQALARAQVTRATRNDAEHRRLRAGLAITYDLSLPGGLRAVPSLPAVPAPTDDGLPRLASRPVKAPRQTGIARIALRASSVPALVGFVVGALFGSGGQGPETSLTFIVAAMAFALAILDRIENDTARALVTVGVCVAPVAGWAAGLQVLG